VCGQTGAREDPKGSRRSPASTRQRRAVTACCDEEGNIKWLSVILGGNSPGSLYGGKGSGGYSRHKSDCRFPCTTLQQFPWDVLKGTQLREQAGWRERVLPSDAERRQRGCTQSGGARGEQGGRSEGQKRLWNPGREVDGVDWSLGVVGR